MGSDEGMRNNYNPKQTRELTGYSSLPNELSTIWKQYPWAWGEAMCRIRALVSEMMSYTSVLTIVAFSLERYLAICHPLQRYRMSGLRRAARIIGVVWVLSLVAASPVAVYTTVDYEDFPPGSGRMLPDSALCMPENPFGVVFQISVILFFMLPMVIMVAIYARIGHKIQLKGRLGKHVDGAVHGDTKQQTKSVVRMLSAVVIAFFVCWAPFHAQRLMFEYRDHIPNFLSANEWMYTVSGCLYYFNSTINPILYNLMSAKYRAAFFQTLCGGRSQSSQSRVFRDQSSVRETSVHNVGETNGNGFKWNRNATGSVRHQPQRRSPGYGDHLENGQLTLKCLWKDPLEGHPLESAGGMDTIVVMSQQGDSPPKCFPVGKLAKALQRVTIRTGTSSYDTRCGPQCAIPDREHSETCM